MKSKTKIMIAVDTIMFVLYLQLTFAYDLSHLFHEVAGIGIGVLFIIHLILNKGRMKALSNKMHEGKLTASRKVLYILDVILVPLMLTTIASGMLIAGELYVGPGGYAVVVLHNIASYTGLAILGLHVALHMKYLAGIARGAMRSDGFQRAYNTVAAAAMVLALVGLPFMTAYGSTGTSATDQSTTDTQVLTATADDTQATTTTTEAVVTDRKGRATTTSAVSESDTSTSDTSSSVSSGSSDTSSDDSSSTTVCTLCGKNCPITNLRCNKGTSWAQSEGLI